MRAGDLLVGESINGYEPASVHPEVWDQVAPQARRWVAMVPVEFGRQAVARLKPLAQYLAWRVEGGMDVNDPTAVFRADDFEYWLATACGHLREGTQSSYRSALRTIGEHVAGTETACPDRTTPIAKPDPQAPYTDREFAAVLGAISGLRTGTAHHNAMAIVAPSRGAGLGTSDITGLVGTDITMADDSVVISVPGPRPRQVAALAAWESELLRLAELCGDKPLFRPDRTDIGPRDIERFCHRLAWIDAPRLSITRARNTWIVEHLAAGIPIHVLAAAAGTTAVSVARYAQFVRLVPDSEARRLLRNGSGLS